MLMLCTRLFFQNFHTSWYDSHQNATRAVCELHVFQCRLQWNSQDAFRKPCEVQLGRFFCILVCSVYLGPGSPVTRKLGLTSFFFPKSTEIACGVASFVYLKQQQVYLTLHISSLCQKQVILLSEGKHKCIEGKCPSKKYFFAAQEVTFH